ncbi:MAG: T9SS type A sorting domain-containing protein [Bacteroidia bacterium]|nr:T9SS type A sorting domain-containing protein [Bacteroidia bacterium]
MKTSLVILLLVLTVKVFCQPYLCIKPDAISYYYANGAETVYPIRIDSAIVHGDTTDYYPFGMIRAIPQNIGLFLLHGPHWTGKKVTDCDNGYNLFYNKRNDTIFIKTDAVLSEIWRLFTYDNGNYINATITSWQAMSFLGLTDSVKTISMQVKDSNGANISDNINSYKLRLSKNFGLTIITDFYEFPFDTSSVDYYYSVYPQMNLTGMTNPAVGWQNITIADIFDYQPGDEYHRQSHCTGSPFDPCWNNEKEMQKILNRTLTPNNDSLLYLEEICSRRYSQCTSTPPQYTTQHDTIQEVILLAGELNKLPLEPTFVGWSYGFYLKNDSKIYDNGAYFEAGLSPDTLSMLIYDGGITITYIKGYGTLYYSWGFLGNQCDNSFVYYKKNNIEWGVPYICDSLLADTISGVKQEMLSENKNPVRVWPIPAYGLLYINITDKNITSFSLKIFDLQGICCLVENNYPVGEPVKISDLKPGLYILKIQFDSRIIFRKILIGKE